MPYNWTVLSVEALTEMWKAGKSASQIAEALGGGLSRNAVIGKVHRLGMARGPEARHVDPHAMARRITARKPKKQHGGKRFVKAKSEPTPPKKEAVKREFPPLEDSTPVSLMDLEAGMCRFPLKPGGEEQVFCAAKVKDGSPYCPHHHAVAYVPEPTRKKLHKRDRRAVVQAQKAVFGW